MKITESITKNATSTVMVDGMEKAVATMNGKVQEDGKISFNSYIQEVALFEANKVAVMEDVDTFLKNLYGMEEQKDEE